jgi:NADH-quinone oxidoreductase subunit G
MYKAAPVLARLDWVAPAGRDATSALASQSGRLKDEPFQSSVMDFYLTNPIARASLVMAEMSALKKASAPPQGLIAAE